MNDDQFMSNHGKTLPNDDKNIVHRHHSPPLNDSEAVQNDAKQGRHHSATGTDGSATPQDAAATG